ncbi:trypsin-like serine protease [Kitasatospora sp. NPDC001683]
MLKAAKPEVAELMKKQEALDKVVDRITGGLDEQNRDRIPGFSEVEVDPGANRATLHWKGELPEAVRGALQDLPQGVNVKVVPAKYSKAELHVAREKLLLNGKPIPLAAKSPSHINSIGPSLDGSGLDLGYETDDERAPQTRTFRPALSAEELTPQVEAIASAIAGVEVHAHPQAMVEDLTRGADYEPWLGGAGVKTPGGTICSTGFGVYNPSIGSKNLVTTAWHCGSGSYRTWYSDKYMGYASEGDGLDTDDTIGIAPLNEQASGSGVYGGPWNDPNDADYVEVSGYSGNNVGDLVCQSAANSGAHCGLRVLQVDRQIQGPNGVWRKFTDQVVQTDPNDIASINGDSGGPVVVQDGSKLRARGTITSLDKKTNCNGRVSSDAGTRTPVCYNGMWYVPISQTLADMGWILKTG